MIVHPDQRQPLPLGRQFLVGIEDLIKDDSAEAELQAVRDFLAQAPLGGTVPASTPYLPIRDEVFIRTWYVGASISSIMAPHLPHWSNLEDAREAIYVGRKAGYSDACIAAYLRRNYLT